MSVTDFPSPWELHCAGRCKESCSYCTMDTSVPVLTESEDPHEEPENDPFTLPATSRTFGSTTISGSSMSAFRLLSTPLEISVEVGMEYGSGNFTLRVSNSDGSLAYRSHVFTLGSGDVFTFTGIKVS